MSAPRQRSPGPSEVQNPIDRGAIEQQICSLSNGLEQVPGHQELVECAPKILLRSLYDPRSPHLRSTEPPIGDTIGILIRTHFGQSSPDVLVRKADLTRDPEYLGLVECTLAVVRI
jgi:hypothetical protein